MNKKIFNSYETVETAFNNDLRAFDANGRTMQARALKGESYYFKSGKTGKKYDISPEECQILNLFYNTLNALNEAQQRDNMMSCYNGNVWWFERAELRRKVIEMVNGYIDAFEAWLNEKNVEETAIEETAIEEPMTDETSNEEVSNEETTIEETVSVETSNDKCETSVVEYKLVDGFEDYMVSSDGKVWSLNYNHTGKMKEMKPKLEKNGYLRVGLWTNGRRVWKLVHRLVAEAFKSNPDNLPEVNHKDEDKTNNSVDNLEWCPVEYNRNYGTRNKRIGETMTNHKAFSVPVVCLETGVIYPSTHEAERQTGVANQSISDCCNGKRKSAGGYHWARFVEGGNPIYE